MIRVKILNLNLTNCPGQISVQSELGEPPFSMSVYGTQVKECGELIQKDWPLGFTITEVKLTGPLTSAEAMPSVILEGYYHGFGGTYNNSIIVPFKAAFQKLAAFIYAGPDFREEILSVENQIEKAKESLYKNLTDQMERLRQDTLDMFEAKVRELKRDGRKRRH